MNLSELITNLKEMEEFVGTDNINVLVENRAGITFITENISYDNERDVVKIHLE